VTGNEFDFLAILRTLRSQRVDFIVVGGVCGALHGAPLSTLDLDVVHSRSQDNVARLMAALRELNAYYRGRPGGRLQPQASHLSSPGHQLLMTRFGPLDLLGTVGAGHDYPSLLHKTVRLRVGKGVAVRALTLPVLIRIKEETAHEKDLPALAILRRTLKERKIRRRNPKLSAERKPAARRASRALEPRRSPVT
jgi:hypothetical protein